ncbi:phage holin family protein [Plantactinospora sp. KLBMP9567]|uniref:phage holin family protein n=1 Tax=Plantactinospora sp. KLBMP9567 TaxID=3085900 RepID=UPI0029821F73|nr:phage holin family protein [Plantactinospora sp. KLBMP9567]MDW5322398.1 phage holin family protein [Plantactinospora sp. KLBMP9567]
MSVSAGGLGADREQDPSRASIGELLGAVTRDTSTLVRQEIQLAKLELRQEMRTAGRVAGMFGGAALGALMVLLFLSYALWWGLSNVMDQGWGALVVAGVWAVVAAILVGVARRQARSLRPLPQTSESIRRMPSAMRDRTQHRSGGQG